MWTIQALLSQVLVAASLCACALSRPEPPGPMMYGARMARMGHLGVAGMTTYRTHPHPSGGQSSNRYGPPAGIMQMQARTTWPLSGPSDSASGWQSGAPSASGAQAQFQQPMVALGGQDGQHDNMDDMGWRRGRGRGRGSMSKNMNRAMPQGYGYMKPGDDDDMSEDAMYSFEYNVEGQGDDGPQFGQHEQREGDVTWGSYHVLLPDGRMQRVDYEADERGFRPRVSFQDTRMGPY